MSFGHKKLDVYRVSLKEENAPYGNEIDNDHDHDNDHDNDHDEDHDEDL